MTRASERLAGKGDRGRREIDDARYWCRWCGEGYEKRSSLSRQGYCIGKECGMAAWGEWTEAQIRLANSRK